MKVKNLALSVGIFIAIGSIAGGVILSQGRGHQPENHVKDGSGITGQEVQASFEASLNQLPSLPTHRLSPGGTIDSKAKFESSRICFSAQMSLESAKSAIIECDSLEGIKEVQDRYLACSAESAKLNVEIPNFERELQNCQGTAEETAKNYFSATSQAAEAGDPDAQACYVESNFGSFQLPIPSQDIWKAKVADYLRQGLMRGDWRMVALAGNANYYVDGPLQQVVGTSLRTRYAMNRLMRLGATQEYAKSLDILADGMAVAIDPATQRRILSGTDIVRAQNWAQKMQRSHFSGSPQLSGTPTACAINPVYN